MALIILGLIIWSTVHLIPAVAPGLKQQVIETLGRHGYRGSFSLLIIGAVVLMTLGWRQSLPTYLYTLPEMVDHATLSVMALACVLFVASKIPSHIKRFVRHPQLSAVALWALTHLLANGDSRSVVLFGGLFLWSVLEIVLINKRDGVWVKPPAAGVLLDVVVLASGGLLFTGLVLAHPYLSGVTLG